MTFSEMLEILDTAAKALAAIGYEYRLEAQASEQTDLVLTSHGYRNRDAPVDEDTEEADACALRQQASNREGNTDGSQ